MMHDEFDKAIPGARRDGLLVEELGDETVVYDTNSKQAHCLSPIAAAVFAHCDGATSLASIAERLTEARGEPVDIATVAGAVAQLEERELVASNSRELDGRPTRREMLGKTAAVGAAAASVPLITSIVAPTAALAQSGCNIGAACTTDDECGATHPSCGGTCGCGPCSSGGTSNKVCSIHRGGAGGCSAPCAFGGQSPPCPC